MFDLQLNQRRRHILHVDADAFFASVEQVLNPKLKGLPLIVGGPSDTRGIVSAASYEAKKFGIYSGMPMYLARRKCPEAIVVRGHFDDYRNFSRKIYNIMTKYTPAVEMASIDEAYMDIGGCELMHGCDYGVAGHGAAGSEIIAKKLLMEIYRKTGLSVSCGLASSKTVAKVASSTNKPHKMTVVPYGKEAKFLSILPLRAMPGIGPKTFSCLETYGLKNIGDFAAMSLYEVLDKLCVQAIPLWKRCRGIDNSEVISDNVLPKSISKEHTFYDPMMSSQLCLKQLKTLSEIVFGKLRSYNLKAKTVFLKIRYKNADGQLHGRLSRHELFRDFSFQKHLDFPTAIDSKLFPVVKELFEKNILQNEAVRLVGIGVTNLFQNYNLSLFDNDEEEEKLFLKIDAMKKLYGDNALRYGA